MSAVSQGKKGGEGNSGTRNTNCANVLGQGPEKAGVARTERVRRNVIEGKAS